MIDGIVVKMSGEEYIVPPLSFKQLRSLQPRLALLSSVNGIPTTEQLEAVSEVVHAALSRNYPDLTADAVNDMLDLGNMGAIIPAIMGVSGLVTAGEGSAGKS